MSHDMGTFGSAKAFYLHCGILQNRWQCMFCLTITCIATLIAISAWYWRLEIPSPIKIPEGISVSKDVLVSRENNTLIYKPVPLIKSVFIDRIEDTIRRKKTPRNLKRLSLSNIEVEKCSKIPPAPEGQRWPEEEFIHDPVPSDIRELADPKKSRVTLEGPSSLSLGDFIRLKIVLHDGYGKRKIHGGDLLRVWMKEDSLGASSNGHVIDNNDGSYVATLQALWVGKPQIRVFIISPREVIAVQFKRRYICPPVLVNTAVFIKGSKGVETPCNYDPHVPGYSELCNLTDLNFGHPWFCGKPRWILMFSKVVCCRYVQTRPYEGTL